MNAIGIDIGGTHTRMARVSEDGRIQVHRSFATVRDPRALLNALIGETAKLRDEYTTAIGIGIPGRVDGRTGKILSGGFVDLSVLPLADELNRASQLPVFTDNDANMALTAEARFGAARSLADAVMLTIGTGIGGAILSGGRVFHGGGLAGQLGHIAVRTGGNLCNCGRTGCLETESSGTALQRHIAEAGLPKGTTIESLLASDSAVITAWIAPLRAGIDNLVAAFGPEIVILGGGLGGSAVKALDRLPAVSPWFQCGVVAAELGDEAGVIGAGLAALERSG